MLNVLFGTKKGMTSLYDSRGRRVGATIVEVKPNVVVQVKTQETDGYNAVQIGFGKKKSVNKPQVEHQKKHGVAQTAGWMREVRTEDAEVTGGQEINLKEVFSKGDLVKVTGVSKGRGFQGGVRRHGFHGGPKTHGQSDRHRAPGSIGSGTTPGRVFKGKNMAGHMGSEQVSYMNLEVVGLDKASNLIMIKGGIPGPVGGMIRVEKTGQVKGYVPEVEEEEVVEEAVVEETPVEAAAEETNETTETVEVAAESTEETVEEKSDEVTAEEPEKTEETTETETEENKENA